jgi:hypothetical protein
MRLFFSVLQNVLIAASLVTFMAVVLWLCWQTDDLAERGKRLLALVLGGLVVAASNALGVTFPHFLVTSLSSSRPIGIGAKVLITLVPGGLGVGMGWYLLYAYQRRPRVAVRFLAFIGMLATASFAGIYAAAATTHGAKLGTPAVPNIAFTVGIILFVVFGNDEKRRGAWVNRASESLRKRRGAWVHRASEWLRPASEEPTVGGTAPSARPRP